MSGSAPMSVTAVPLRPIAKGSVAKLWIGLLLLALVAAAAAWWGTAGQQWTRTPSGLQYRVVKEGQRRDRDRQRLRLHRLCRPAAGRHRVRHHRGQAAGLASGSSGRADSGLHRGPPSDEEGRGLQAPHPAARSLMASAARRPPSLPTRRSTSTSRSPTSCRRRRCGR